MRHGDADGHGYGYGNSDGNGDCNGHANGNGAASNANSDSDGEAYSDAETPADSGTSPVALIGTLKAGTRETNSRVPRLRWQRPAKGGSARRGGTMTDGSPKAQISGGKAALLSQRVEDNAFHLAKPHFSCQPVHT